MHFYKMDCSEVLGSLSPVIVLSKDVIMYSCCYNDDRGEEGTEPPTDCIYTVSSDANVPSLKKLSLSLKNISAIFFPLVAVYLFFMYLDCELPLNVNVQKHC